jgi:trimethylamine--corrinoid protein Co-methyltransferase
MMRSELSGRLRKGRFSRNKSANNDPAKSLAGRRIVGLSKCHGPLSDADLLEIHDAVLELLETTGFVGAPQIIVDLVVAAGGDLDPRGRLTFPKNLIKSALCGLRRDVKLWGRGGDTDLDLTPGHVFVGTGGASPMVYDWALGKYRGSVLSDLYDAACLVDQLNHIHFFSRPLVARDMPDMRHLDVNTAYACLAGTRKHAFISATAPASVRDIAQICYQLAGSKDAFRQRPFLSINVNHVIPPMRFDPDALEVMMEAVRCGIPVMINTFGQLGASSPVTIAGCVAQTTAETLAGMVIAWLVDPAAKAVFGPRPMITDLRTGAMAGGGGEQATLTAASMQMARHYGFASSTIAGATDSKIPDAQSGYEKCLTVAQAVYAGANIVTQACGAQAGLMGISLEAMVIDNDMLGAILRSTAKVDVSAETVSAAAIGRVATGIGHFLGEAETYARMHSDFLYPELADRSAIDVWQAAGSRDISARAADRVRDLLASHRPYYIDPESDNILRTTLPIKLAPPA